MIGKTQPCLLPEFLALKSNGCFFVKVEAANGPDGPGHVVRVPRYQVTNGHAGVFAERHFIRQGQGLLRP